MSPTAVLTTERSHFRFTVKEGEHSIFIWAEPAGDQLTVLTAVDGHLFFDLRPGTTYEQAQEIAKYLNRDITAIGLMADVPAPFGGNAQPATDK